MPSSSSFWYCMPFASFWSDMYVAVSACFSIQSRMLLIRSADARSITVPCTRPSRRNLTCTLSPTLSVCESAVCSLSPDSKAGSSLPSTAIMVSPSRSPETHAGPPGSTFLTRLSVKTSPSVVLWASYFDRPDPCRDLMPLAISAAVSTCQTHAVVNLAHARRPRTFDCLFQSQMNLQPPKPHYFRSFISKGLLYSYSRPPKPRSRRVSFSGALADIPRLPGF